MSGKSTAVLADLLLTQHREGGEICWWSGDCFYRLGTERRQEVLGLQRQPLAAWHPRPEAGRAGESPFTCWDGDRVEGSESHDWASVQAPSRLPLTSSNVPLKASFSVRFKPKKFLFH